jgi:hypothetical protein
MTEVKNLYLSRCPCEQEHDLEDLTEFLNIALWAAEINTKETKYFVTIGNKILSNSKYEECKCTIETEQGRISTENSKDAVTPLRKRHYKCNFKIEDNPELAKLVEEYFKENNMLVDTFDSDV